MNILEPDPSFFGRRSHVQCSVRPRYTCGSPASVPWDIASRVAEEERGMTEHEAWGLTLLAGMGLWQIARFALGLFSKPSPDLVFRIERRESDYAVSILRGSGSDGQKMAVITGKSSEIVYYDPPDPFVFDGVELIVRLAVRDLRDWRKET